MKKIIYSVIGLFLLKFNYTSAAIGFGGSKVNTDLKGSNEGADTAIQVLIKNALLFLYLVAVIYGLWGGFLILTAGGKEDNVKKGRTVIVQALIGLIVIYLASSIVQWLVNSILSTT